MKKNQHFIGSCAVLIKGQTLLDVAEDRIYWYLWRVVIWLSLWKMFSFFSPWTISVIAIASKEISCMHNFAFIFQINGTSCEFLSGKQPLEQHKSCFFPSRCFPAVLENHNTLVSPFYCRYSHGHTHTHTDARTHAHARTLTRTHTAPASPSSFMHSFVATLIFMRKRRRSIQARRSRSLDLDSDSYLSHVSRN